MPGKPYFFSRLFAKKLVVFSGESNQNSSPIFLHLKKIIFLFFFQFSDHSNVSTSCEKRNNQIILTMTLNSNIDSRKIVQNI